MTNTPMSEREKELIPLVREALAALLHGPHVSLSVDLDRALRAYDPKPEKQYTMPEWKEFANKIDPSNVGAEEVYWVHIGKYSIHFTAFNAIREALSKPKAPTE